MKRREMLSAEGHFDRECHGNKTKIIKQLAAALFSPIRCIEGEIGANSPALDARAHASPTSSREILHAVTFASEFSFLRGDKCRSITFQRASFVINNVSLQASACPISTGIVAIAVAALKRSKPPRSVRVLFQSSGRDPQPEMLYREKCHPVMKSVKSDEARLPLAAVLV